MSSVVSYFMLSFFPCDVLDEIWDAIESVPENLPTYFYTITKGYLTRCKDCNNVAYTSMKHLFFKPIF